MKNISINLPYPYEKGIQLLIKKKICNNRSEAIRKAIEEFLQDTSLFLKELNGGICQ